MPVRTLADVDRLLEDRPSRIFDALCLGTDADLAEQVLDAYEIVVLPGERPRSRPQAGDLLIRRADGGRGCACVLDSAELSDPADLGRTERGGPGRYAEMLERGQPSIARRIVDAAGRAPFDQLLLRPRQGTSFQEGSVSDPAYVRWVQSALNEVIGASLAVDGAYGPRTREAVRAFQRRNGLAVDGIAGPRTESALRSALESRTAPARCRGLDQRQVLDQFPFGRHEVQPSHQPQIVNTAFCLLESQRSSTPINRLTIVGHTDPVGDEAANLDLGRRRAEAVRDEILTAMARISGRPAQLEVFIESRGEREPGPDPGASRRVEVLAPIAYVPRPVTPPPPPPPAATTLDPPRWRPILSRRMSRNVTLQTGNGVRHLIDAGNPDPVLAGYRAMVEAIRSATGRSHYVYLLAWCLVDDFEMIPGDPTSTPRRLLADASGRGVQIRVMVWRHVPGTALFAPTEASAVNINALANGAAIVDNETLSPSLPPFGSHHQKVLVVKGEAGLVGFVGGLDLNPDRLTAGAGSGSGGSSGGVGAPLHDVHCRVVGPSAWDLLETFRRRWDHHPGHIAIDRRAPLRGRGELRPRPLRSPSSTSSSTGRTSSVIVARTFNPVTRGTTIRRERDIRVLLLEAIANARRFIYMEDQYLVSLEAARALRAAVPRLQHLTIVIPGSEAITDMPCIWTFRRDFVRELTRGLSTTDRAKVRIFRLATPPFPSPLPACGSTPPFIPTYGPHTYVHAKMWVFDDELAVIGSANCNRRGWEHDSECDAFIFDDAKPTGGALTFAQQLRIDLWKEHLNVSASVLTDGVASGTLWVSLPGNHRVIPYCPDDGRDTGVVFPERNCGPGARDIIDPAAP